MRLPPALTWAHLFPADARWSFANDGQTPDWFREQLAMRSALLSTSDESRPSVLVAFGRDVDVNAQSLDPHFGILGIDCPTRASARLAAQGFAYVRRFAVLPDLRTARWFVPLDSPALSAAAFSLYTPSRASAKLKVAAAKLAMRAHLPVWYRHTLWIAQRTPPPLEHTLHTLYGGRPLRLALSSGAPEPARNRKTSVAILSLDRGEILAFAKIAASSLAKELLEHEQAALRELSLRAACAPLVPRLLFAGTVEDAAMTVQCPSPGAPAGQEFTDHHRTFLEKLRDASRTRPAAASAMIRLIRERAERAQTSSTSAAALRTELRDRLRDLAPALSRLLVPTTIVHGDFAPWNLRLSAGGLAAFDWEYADLDGLPLIDETHFAVQVGFLLENWNVARALAELRRAAASAPLGLSAEDAGALQCVYLLDAITRLLGEGYDQTNDMVAWYVELLRALAPHMPAPTVTSSTSTRSTRPRGEAVGV
jgi:hypothetical protein